MIQKVFFNLQRVALKSNWSQVRFSLPAKTTFYLVRTSETSEKKYQLRFLGRNRLLQKRFSTNSMAVVDLCEFTLAQREPMRKTCPAKVLEIVKHEKCPGDERQCVGETKERAVNCKTAVHLDQSILHYLGGGQPSDAGTVGGVRCEFVEKDAEGKVWHWLDLGDASECPFGVGDEVEVVIDWARRWHHMQNHSAQHIVSAVVADMFGAPTVSWELGQETTMIELKFDDKEKAKTLAQRVEEIESLCNGHVRDAKNVKALTVDGNDQAGLDKLLETGLCRDGVPAVGSFPVVRFIEIEDTDINACGGTHVPNTAMLQAIKIVLTPSANRGNWCLTFQVGEKLLRRFTSMISVEADLAKALCVGPSGYVDMVKRRQDELKEGNRQIKFLKSELALVEGKELAATAEKQGTGLLAVHKHSSDMAFLKEVATSYDKNVSAPAKDNVVLWMTCDGLDPKNALKKGPVEGAFLLCGAKSKVESLSKKQEGQEKSCTEQVAALLEGRGGGKGVWQGLIN